MVGLRTLEENIDRLEKANEETRQVTREAHEAIKTTRLVLKELKEERDRWERGIQKEVDEAVERQVRMGLEDFKDTVAKQTSIAHQNVIDEFDKLKNIMLYGNETGRGPSLVDEWIRRAIRDEFRNMKTQL